MSINELLISDLPDRESAERFAAQLSPANVARLNKDKGLYSDVLTLAAFSPLLATTLLQHNEYFAWLGRKRRDSGLRTKDELMESLARFQLTNSQLEPQVVFSRFRRRELLRIYLRDIRRLATIAQITEEISNVADAILESALQFARREMDNRFGRPQETDEKGRAREARFCVVALGKLGSHELNYSSDIDLLFLYSTEGNTSGSGSRGQVTNREYFVKLAQLLTKLVGEQSGEGGAYRVDLRLRPNGTMGALAMSLTDTVSYYRSTARPWERQVMIRSRSSAGDSELYKELFTEIESLVFSRSETPASALASVRRSKEMIDTELSRGSSELNVKLSPGGIRDIEFIAQALQLAHGGRDAWLHSSHTLISLARLADRSLITDKELTELSNAYDFLRRTEHVLQMENGLQTHTVPDDPEKRKILGARMAFVTAVDFERGLRSHTSNVRRAFERVFDTGPPGSLDQPPESTDTPTVDDNETDADIAIHVTKSSDASLLEHLSSVSPHFAPLLANANWLADHESYVDEADLRLSLHEAIKDARDFSAQLGGLRRQWSKHLLSIAIDDILGRCSIADAKRRQTSLAEASIAISLEIVADEMARRYSTKHDEIALSILALGKLGGRGIDYGSDLDLVLVHDDNHAGSAETHARAAELLVTTLSSMTRDGSLYRVDLRLRPFGSKGAITISGEAFADYMKNSAAIWEMLAFVKIRGVVGENAEVIENDVRTIIHSRASAVPPEKLRDETLKVRHALERQRSQNRRTAEIDIKYGEGGMLDIYFAMRYLQLRDSIPDVANDRSTPFMLDVIRKANSLTPDTFAALSDGYTFLSTLDHQIRLTIGRSTRVPVSHAAAMKTIAERMQFDSPGDLLETLALHRLSIRSAFDEILS